MIWTHQFSRDAIIYRAGPRGTWQVVSVSGVRSLEMATWWV